MTFASSKYGDEGAGRLCTGTKFPFAIGFFRAFNVLDCFISIGRAFHILEMGEIFSSFLDLNL